VRSGGSRQLTGAKPRIPDDVVPGLVEVEVAVPRLTPALRSVLGDRQVDPRDRATVKKNYQKNAATATTPVLPEAVSVAMAELAGDGRRSA
jgi:hypothetical protein